MYILSVEKIPELPFVEICDQLNTDKQVNQIFSLITNTTIPTLYINGYIGKGEDDKVNIDLVTNLLSQVQGRKLNMEINSGGGSMMEGFAIYDALVNSGLEINGTITGVAGSMAGVLMLACKKLEMYKHARIMTHKAKLIVYGEPDGIKAQADLAADMENQAKALFKERTKQSDEVIESWFKAGVDKWFNSDEALRFGLVDTVVEGVVHIPEDMMPTASTESDLVNIYNKLNSNNMSKTPIILNQTTANKIGMPVNTDSDALVAKVEILATENETLTTANVKLKADLKAKEDADATQKAADATALVENAIKTGKIDAKAKESFIKQATENYGDVKNMLDGIQERKSIKDQVHGFGQKSTSAGADMTDKTSWNYLKWSKEDPKGLAEMRTNDPEAFEALKTK